jgi:hypothetical protein
MDSADQTALYVDILGFEQLIEAHPEAITTHPPDADRSTSSGTSESSLLYNRFFSRILESQLFSETLNGGLRAMIFSDCAFIVGGTALRTALFAVELMRECVLNHVPVRMGVASGSFNSIRTTTDEFDSSVISRSMFTGTSITRAAKAEGNPLKGMRIFVHPKTTSAALDNIRLRVKVLPLRSPSKSAGWELDYSRPQGRDVNQDTSEEAELKLFRAVAEMRQPDMTKRVKRHYTETVKALNEMRKANGRAAVGKNRSRRRSA